MSIFIQIASYRDPELLPTIRNCIQHATYPENLRFGICWQHAQEDVWDDLSPFYNDPRFRIMDVPWKESKGLGWARHHTQKLYQGETYTMQIDSHHRFIPSWDTELIEMMQQTGSAKPILTTYGAPYTPGEPLIDPGPYIMLGKKFSSYGTILFYPHSIPNSNQLHSPIKARFVSGHFFFTLGQHCYEYKYDPDIYFAGDEISLSIRSFTLGYDLYHPHKTIMWHEYTRSGRKKHWDDFNKKRNDTPAWYELDDYSKKKLRHLLQEEDNHIDIGEYGLGTVRTHAEYEQYAGISFKTRRLHPSTTAGLPPPVNDETNWVENHVINHIKQILNWSSY
jgi:Glycosyltransferase (GlcNAc)